jgi:hypothetical protein
MSIMEAIILKQENGATIKVVPAAADPRQFPPSGGGKNGQGTWWPEMIMWPDDADAIAARTGGALTTLHGPIVGGASCNR